MRAGFRDVFAILSLFSGLILTNRDISATPATTNSNARILLHLLAAPSASPCGAPEAAPACGGILTRGDLAPANYYACVLVTNGIAEVGLAGLQFGIQYGGESGLGVDIFSWTHCATLQWPTPGWPAAGTGNLVTWNYITKCQRSEPGGPGTGVTALVGYFYLSAYTKDELRVTTFPDDDAAKVADCEAVESIVEGLGIHYDPPHLGYASFSAGATEHGYNPCSKQEMPLTCGITGPVVVHEYSGGHDYAATSNDPTATFQWSLTGNGAIVGPTTGPSVSVHPGAYGRIELAVDTRAGQDVARCGMTVYVTHNPTPPGCFILGSGQVLTGSAGNLYSANRSAAGYAWSISGNGTIAGPADDDEVRVDAGVPGQFTLTLTLEDPGRITTCAKNVGVSMPPPVPTCTISGPDTLFANSLPVNYDMFANDAVETYAWSVSGEATILTPTFNPGVAVRPRGPGSFTLLATRQGSGPSLVCTKTVTVTDAPCVPPRNRNAKLLVHLAAATTKTICNNATTAPPCQGVKVAGGLYPPKLYYAFVLVADAEASAGVGGTEFGIDYDGMSGRGIDVFSWGTCFANDYHAPGWPEAGTGNLVKWSLPDRCQQSEPGGPGTGVVARVGYFYVGAYTPDNLAVTPHPDEGVARVFDCQPCPTPLVTGGPGPSALGFAAFTAGGTSGGYNPCGLGVPIVDTTWGAIKSLYR